MILTQIQLHDDVRILVYAKFCLNVVILFFRWVSQL